MREFEEKNWSGLFTERIDNRDMEITVMKIKKIYQRATCPYCFGPLVRVVEGEDPGMHLEFTVCGGGCQGRKFLPPWWEHQWSEPESRPIPAELAIEIEEYGDQSGVVREDTIVVSEAA
jgi:hypothetical protein